ncbi:hypothetical protein [Thermosynechococcus sp. NK55a]|uniref:hypothetical protein n=1 Tax=Thermosynechococcus sp. NK55a TaxID=1394889 RepID=UPI00040EDA47|nr:hypothetical protein [Thermosynechococcus sp. NK55a]
MFKQRTKIVTIAAGWLASAISGCGLMVTETEITNQPPVPPAATPTTPEATAPKPSAAGSAVAALTPPPTPKPTLRGFRILVARILLIQFGYQRLVALTMVALWQEVAMALLEQGAPVQVLVVPLAGPHHQRRPHPLMPKLCKFLVWPQ